MPPPTITATTDNGDGTYNLTFDCNATVTSFGALDSNVLLFDGPNNCWQFCACISQVDAQTVQIQPASGATGLGALIIWATPQWFVLDNPFPFSFLLQSIPFP